MLDVTIRELEYVVAVESARSITGAARDLHMAQPSLSAALARLERRLGTTLFHRTSRHLEPTAAGARLAADAAHILRTTGEALARARGDAPVGVVVHVNEPALDTPRRLVPAIRKALPGVRVDLTSTRFPSAPSDDATHLALTLGHPIAGPNVNSRQVTTDQVGALVPASHPLIRSATVTLVELARFRLVSIDDSTSRWNEWVSTAFAREGLRPEWTTASVFGVTSGADLACADNSPLICLRTTEFGQRSDARWIPIAPHLDADWFASWFGNPLPGTALHRAVSALAPSPTPP